MRNINLKNFQYQVVEQLFEASAVGDKREILLKSPTGSGKTIILVSFIEEYLKDFPKTCFVWLTPGKGNLEMQSKEKMDRYLPTHNTKTLDQVLLQGISEKDTLFLNWESVTKKDNIALKETERKNLLERIEVAQNDGIEFVIIIDEEHLNKTSKAEYLVNKLNPKRIIRASATVKTNKEAVNITIADSTVIEEGLITKALYINENVKITDVITNEHEYLLNLALDKRKEIKAEYIKLNSDINPLIIIQVPSKSTLLINEIESYLNTKNVSYDRGNLAVWLSDSKKNIEQIEKRSSEQTVLIMKQAISTGWDCPRAKILVKLRDNMSEDFETQTLGRIRRMPEACHYENPLLDNCFLYTFDEKYEESVKSDLGSNAHNVKIVFLKDKHKPFTLKKVNTVSGVDKFDERHTFKLLFNYYKEKYGLGNNKKINKESLEKNEYVFKETIDRVVMQGAIVKIEDLSETDRITVQANVSTNKNGWDMKTAINVISSKIGMRPDRTRLMLERMFHRAKLFQNKFVDLNLQEFYAFVINNIDILKYDFLEAVVNKARHYTLNLDDCVTTEWKMPEKDLIKYDDKMKDTEIYDKNVYLEYPSSTIKSTSERMFESYCEKSGKIDWFYKNGESSSNYFSVLYSDGTGKLWNFYPDYILEDNNGNTWVIETKGGESASGESKNIDAKSKLKFDALKNYANENGFKFGFVRDYDKNHSLYINTTEYEEDMSSDSWKKLENVLGV